MKRKVNIEPVPQGRARQRIVNGHVWTYTPKATADAKKAIQDALTKRPIIPFDPLVPLKLTVTFYRLKSRWLKRKETMPVRKPDLDNFVALLSNALSGLAFADDAQLTTMIVKKRWTPQSKLLKRGKMRPATAKGYIVFSLTEDNHE